MDLVKFLLSLDDKQGKERVFTARTEQNIRCPDAVKQPFRVGTHDMKSAGPYMQAAIHVVRPEWVQVAWPIYSIKYPLP